MKKRMLSSLLCLALVILLLGSLAAPAFAELEPVSNMSRESTVHSFGRIGTVGSRVRTEPDQTAATPTPAPTETPKPEDPVSYYLISYTLQAGETVYEVCQKLGIDYRKNSDTIAKINNIKDFSKLRSGTVLLLPSGSAPSYGAYYKVVAHKVVKGDTVGEICKANGVDYSKTKEMIKVINKKTNLTVISVGETIYIPIAGNAGPAPAAPTATPAPSTPTATPAPGTPTATPAPSTPTASPAPTAAPAASPAPTAKPEGQDTVTSYLIRHTMESGETVYKVCEKLGIDYRKNSDLIAKLNNIKDYSKVRTGTVVLLPSNTAPSSGSYYKLVAHTVEKGETVSKICKALGVDYGKSKEMIKAINKKNNLGLIHVGDILYIPVAANAGSAPATPTATPAPSTPTATPAPGATPAPAASPVPTAAPTTAPEITDPVSSFLVRRTLEAGETVYEVCQKMGIDYRKNSDLIKKINNIKDFSKLRAGTVLLLPSSTAPATGSYYKVVAHKVVKGDTVSKICKAMGVDYGKSKEMIKALNNKTNLTLIHVGDTLYIPVPAAGNGTPETPTATPAPSTPTPTSSGTTPGSTMTYTMKPGDTVASVCQRLGIDFYKNADWISAINKIKNYRTISVGQQLILPTPEPTPKSGS